MTPLAACVVAFLAGCLAAGGLALEPETAARGGLLACMPMVLGARLAWAGHAVLARIAMVGAAALLGVALGSLAEARAWAPPGADVDRLERAAIDGEPLRLEGVLRRDAWVSPAGGVSLDLEVTRIWWRGSWRHAAVGVRATVAGDSAPAQLAEWTRGRRLRAPIATVRRPLPYRNFGTPDAERALARRGLRLFATIKSASLVETSRAPWFEEGAAAMRARVRRVTATHVRDPAAAATVNAILIGDRSGLHHDTVRDLQHAGVYHVVAISGGNVGIWLALLVWLPRAAGTGARLGLLWLATGLLGFAFIVDGGASVTRAVTAAGVIVAARWWDIRTSALQALVVAAGLQWLADPLAWHDAGCVLSFGAAGTLVAVAAVWQGAPGRPVGAPHVGRLRWGRRAATALGALMGATLAVEAVLLPITARWFHVATAAGLFANVLAVPAMGVVQVAGLALIPAAAVWASLGDVIGAAATVGVRLLLRSADVVAIAPWLVREVPPPSLEVLAWYYLGIAGACVCAFRAQPTSAPPISARSAAPRDEGQRRMAGGGAVRLTAAACASVSVGCLGWMLTGGIDHSAPAPWTWRAASRWQRASWPREPWLLVTILDVGQGDATVVRFPSGRTWLVDAGGSVSETFDTGERVTSPALWALGHRLLDRVVVTHAHPDHAAGMPTIIRRLLPREVLGGIAVAGDHRQADVGSAATGAAARERWLAAGEAFVDGPVRVSVLHPARPDWERRRVRNDDSVVLWIRHGDVGVLLPGDIGQSVEDRLAPRIRGAPLTVLRLAHHGSASSTGPRLLAALQPALAVVSAGHGNRFGHPSRAVIGRLAAQHVPVLRTDEVGAIQLATNGRVLLVRAVTGLEGTLTAGPARRAWWLATPPPSPAAWLLPPADRPRPGGLRPIRTDGGT